MMVGRDVAAFQGLSKGHETPSARGLRRLGLGYFWRRSQEARR